MAQQGCGRQRRRLAAQVAAPIPEPESTTDPPVGRPGRLFVIATPIGTLADLSPRAQQTLAAVDLILAEDTRHVRKLLNHFALPTPTRSLHEHNEEREVPRLLEQLANGRDLALVSDAGTPLLADPGFRLVRACRERGIAVLAVPGPSAVAAAISIAGLPPVPFTFAGFPPARAKARDDFLAAFAPLQHTLVLFISPHRLAEQLAACAVQLGGERDAALLGEISKLHERCERGTLAELAAAAASLERRGELTLVVGPPAIKHDVIEIDAEVARAALEHELAAGHPLGEARRRAASRLGVSRRDFYQLLRTDRRE
jgi:16S rRNA (cytidine1402-2'-O)-methyltransferase